MGWMGRSHGRRDGARLGQCDVHQRRRLSVVAHRAQVKADCIRRCSGAEIDHPHETGTMQVRRSSVFILWMAGVLGSATLVHGQSLPLEPRHDAGQSITAAFEGWFANQDGTYSILLGYYNRNRKQDLDIPVGPSNQIEPGGPDQGQPTHFLSGRQWGVFTVKVPNDFGTRKLTWTLVANGQTNVITMHLKPEWIVEPYEDAANKNTPPVLKFVPDGP